MKRILSLLLAVAMSVSAVPTAFAADTQDHSLGTQVVFTAENNENYTITVPASLNPGQSGTVTLDGYWPDSKTVTVTAEKTVTLKNSIKAADTKTLNVTFLGISEAGSNTSKQTFTEPVSVEGISNALFGTWSGKFNYNVDSTEEEVVPPSENYIGTVSTDNTITLSGVESAGTYTLRYANANGALENYADICSLEVTDPATAVSYDDLIAENCAPVEATSIAVYNAADEKVGDIALGGLKTNLGTKLYSFGALADIHINEDSNNQANVHTEKALKYLTNTANVDFTCIPGDLTQHASNTEFAMLQSLINQYGPVYVSTGNHDTPNYRGTDDITNEFLETYTGNPKYYSFTYGNDVFIMFGLNKDVTHILFDDAAEDWLYQTLEANRDKRIFLFQHVFPRNSSGNPYNAYEIDLLVGLEETFFTSLLEHYPNITLFHGHSHNRFDTQKISDTATIDTSGTFNSIHIPSASQPKDVVFEDGAYVQHFNYRTLEGYVVDVYESGIVLRGVDMHSEDFQPIAQYYIATPISTVEAGTFHDTTVTANAEPVDIQWLYATGSDKTTGEIYQVGKNTNYSVSEPIAVDSGYAYKVRMPYIDFNASFCALCYDSENNYLGMVEIANNSGDFLTASEVLSLPQGTASFRLRIWDGGNFDKRTNTISIVKAPQ